MTAARIHLLLLAAAVAGGTGLPWVASRCGTQLPIEAGFWFEEVTFDAPRLGGPITSGELEAIAPIARDELARAFAGLRMTVSDSREARFRVRVVQQLRDERLRRVSAVAGASRAVPGFGGSGAVNFEMLASSAIAYAPLDADRAALLAAIGRGVGRAAVHEFAHQLLPKAPIHSTDPASYEYESAARREQYYGEMRWGVAWPLLQERLAPSVAVSQP